MQDYRQFSLRLSYITYIIGVLFPAVFSISGCGGGSLSDINSVASTSSNTLADTRQARIVNGQLIGQDELPFVKRLFVLDALGQIQALCSGTFISPMHFLTAAHCVISPEEGLIPAERLAVEIRPGEFTLSAGVAPHPAYSPQSIAPSSEFSGLVYFAGDIAIVLVPGYEDEIMPVSTRIAAPGSGILIAGYGTTHESLPSDALLRYGFTQIEAVSMNDGVFYWGFDSLLESNTCYGDSGGPAITQFGPDEPLVLVGVTSGGINGCSPGSISFDTMASHPAYFEFINQVTGGFFAYY